MELDNPAWWALRGAQGRLGTSAGGAARFDPDVSPFGGFEDRPAASDWTAMATLTGPGGTVAIISPEEDLLPVPGDWSVSWTSPGVQMVGSPEGLARPGPSPGQVPADRPVPLGEPDVPEMLALVAVARPGPFSSRTVEFGGYVGVRRAGRLVAMAGERLRLPGYTELSAVATHPDHRREGLAELLIDRVASGILARGEVPFLHAAAGNVNAIRLYRNLGFTVRRTVRFSVVDAPPTA